MAVWQLGMGQSAAGTLVFEISSKDAVVRIDGRVLTLAKQRSIELPAGTYRVETWAPYFAVHEDEVTVTAGRVTRYQKGLVNKSADYQPYLDARSAFATKKLKRTIPDLTLTAAWATLGYVQLGRNIGETRAAYTRALAQRAGYLTSINPEAIGQAEIGYARLTADYEDAKARRDRRLTVGIPTMAVATGALVYHLIRRSKHRPERPVYTPSNPFITSGSAPAFRLRASGRALGLSLNF